MLFPARHRYHPRSQQERERDRRHAAVRAEVADVSTRLQTLEKEQRVQFKRIAEIQQQLDELMRVVKKRLEIE